MAFSSRIIIIATVSLAMFLGSAVAQKNANKDNVLSAKDTARLSDLGLPLYPGARVHQDASEGSSAASLNILGAKLVIMRFETHDEPGKVANFYRKALVKYGRVVDCSVDAKTTSNGDGLSCDEPPEPGAFTLMAGTKYKEHVVGVRQKGGVTVIQLAYAENSDSSNRK
jgi:hypothetical protein